MPKQPMQAKNKLQASVIVTYRCNAKCNMCDVWHHPSRQSEEVGLDVYDRLPPMFFTNITGGEPFIRQDLPAIVELLRTKTQRIVISTNGYFTERIVALCEKYPDLGIRISMEGLGKTNDDIRGLPDGFDRTLRTLFTLREMGIKDIGLGMTVQDSNYQDLVPLHDMSAGLGYEFATATLHNSHYFHKWDNKIAKQTEVIAAFEKLIDKQLRSSRPKNWFRAYFNYGLITYIKGQPRLLPCDMGSNGFFIDPAGDVLPCNGMDEKFPMGNLKTQAWEEIWSGDQARRVRVQVKACPKNCWMIGSAAPAIWEHPLAPGRWVMKNKLQTFFKAPA
jgi:MoaA/NifB/PqqE/SkfB family radical SAM enzyme